MLVADPSHAVVAASMNPNGYPFMTRRQILERIAAEPAFAAECIAIIQERHERRTEGSTESMGWMASHTGTATELAAKLASGEATEKERAEAAQLVRSYAKQLARVFRDRELAARPDLAAQAAVFGVGTGGGGDAPAAAEPLPEHPSPVGTDVQVSAAPGDPAPLTKKRGRPKGSKSKPKTDQPVRRRRRS